MHRSSGILMAISSLPSPYGIGTLGKAAYDFADFLEKAGQKYWQILPLGPTGYGDSPYQSFSSYAGNPYYIDLDLLIEDGLLTCEEVLFKDWGSNPRYVDYGKIYENRFTLLRLSAERGLTRDSSAVQAFVEANQRWLPDYALFMACKMHNDMKPWYEWPEDLRLRSSRETLDLYSEMYRDDIDLFIYIQFLFFRQWERLRDYVHKKGIRIIGDLPIYVSMDSADVWSEPGYFLLDKNNVPIEIAGVPPDYFSENGQLWGNPLYRWEKMENDGFGWWIRRIDGAAKLYDVIRIDHFRGFDSYWSVPYGSDTAKNGRWNRGPGMKLISTLNNWFRDVDFIAEDLGAPMESVVRLLEDSGWPGMTVLEFAFDPKEPSSYLPHNHRINSVCYTATHDNEPLMLWKEKTSPETIAYTRRYLAMPEEEELNWGILRGGMSSVARLFIAPVQDYLGLGAGCCMNNPGTGAGNWQWRLLKGELKESLAARIRSLAELYGRCERARMESAAETPDENLLRQQAYNADWKF